MFCPALSIGAAFIIIRTAPPSRIARQGKSAAHHQSTQALLPTPSSSALLRRKMLLLRKSICTGAIHLPLCFLMSYGFLARSRASIRSAAENCYRRNSLPPLNNLNQAETRSAASRLRRFCAVKCFCSAKAFAQGEFTSPEHFNVPRVPRAKPRVNSQRSGELL